MATRSTTAITASDTHVGICTHSAITIFTPTKARITASPCWRNRNRPCRSASRKYIERSPRMAKAFEENTMNCSWLTASTAGTLSTAKIRSVSSTSTSTANSGVASRRPSILVNRRGPCSSGVLGTTRLTRRRNRLLPGSTGSSSPASSSRAAVNSRNAPNTYSTQSKRSMRATPAKMNVARSTRAPKMPQNSTRCWYIAGTAK